MSHAFDQQNEAPQADGRSDGCSDGRELDDTFRARSPQTGGFFSDVVWLERRQEDDSPDARDAR